MPSTVVIGHLHAASSSARQTLIDTLSKVLQYSQANEPGVVKFCFCTPLPEEDDGKSLFAIEEYADQETFDTHMASAAVAELLKTFGAKPELFGAETDVYVLPCGPTFTRPSVTKYDDPYVIFASFDYQQGTLDQVVTGKGGWSDLVASLEREQQGTLSYTVLADEKANMLRTVEIYESKEYLENEHLKSEAVKANQQQNGAMRTGDNKVWRLKRVTGYLFKERSSSSKL